MQKFILLILVSCFPFAAFASWQVANPNRGVPGAQGQHNLGYPSQYQPKVVATLFKGTLQSNVEQIAKDNGWALNWQVTGKPMVLLQATIAGNNFVEVMNQLLSHYPVKVTYNFDFHNKGKNLTVEDAVKGTPQNAQN